MADKEPKFGLSQEWSKETKKAERDYSAKVWRDKHALHVNVLNVILIVMLVSSIIAVLQNRDVFTLKGILQICADCPAISLDWLDWSQLSLGDWGIFNFLRDFILLNIDMVNAGLFCSTIIVNTATFLLYFLWVIFL